MNGGASRPDSAQGESMTPGMGLGTEPSQVSERCNCQRYGIFRWYPPMMFITTAAAAVFCWMYVTKPVFVTEPARQSLDIEPVIQDQAPVEESEPVLHTAALGMLDPDIGSLPGDHAPPGKEGEDDEIPGEELKPLIVKRQGPPLFHPVPPDEMPRRTGIAETSSATTEGDAANDGPVRNQVVTQGIASPGRGREIREDSASGNFHVHASFMAEFSAVEQTRKKQSQP